MKISQSAKTRVEGLLAAQAGARYLRLGLTRSGCNGFAYKIELADGLAEGEVELQANGVRLAVSPGDFEKLNGVELDWVTEGLSSRLAINNPNTRSSCGCGESVGF